MPTISDSHIGDWDIRRQAQDQVQADLSGSSHFSYALDEAINCSIHAYLGWNNGRDGEAEGL